MSYSSCEQLLWNQIFCVMAEYPIITHLSRKINPFIDYNLTFNHLISTGDFLRSRNIFELQINAQNIQLTKKKLNLKSKRDRRKNKSSFITVSKGWMRNKPIMIFLINVRISSSFFLQNSQKIVYHHIDT